MKAESIYQPRKLDAEKALAEAKRKMKSMEDRRAYGVVRSWFDQRWYQGACTRTDDARKGK